MKYVLVQELEGKGRNKHRVRRLVGYISAKSVERKQKLASKNKTKIKRKENIWNNHFKEIHIERVKYVCIYIEVQNHQSANIKS